MPRFEIDPDITRARTPPAALYGDEAWHAAVVERVLPRSWQWIGDADELAEAGRVLPRTLLPESLDEPLLLARDRTGTARALSNVCTHRGALLCDRAGAPRELRCGYHGRRFGLDGRLVHAPGFEEAVDFPGPSDDLARLPLEQLGPLLFTSLAPAVPFAEWIAPVRARLDWLPWDTMRFAPERARDYEVDASWILYCENYLEGLHIPYVHPGLARQLDVAGYATECFAWGSFQIGTAAPGEPAFEPPPEHPDAGRGVAGYYAWLFPNLMLNLYPWGLSLNVVEPRGPRRTRVRFRSYVARPELVDAGAGAALHQVELEDEAIVESVQRGVRARMARPGRYAPAHEAGTHHFHRLLATALAGG